jgi:hypothetical protein
MSSVRSRMLITLSGVFLAAWVIVGIFAYIEARYEVENLCDAQYCQRWRRIVYLSVTTRQLSVPKATKFCSRMTMRSVAPSATKTNCEAATIATLAHCSSFSSASVVCPQALALPAGVFCQQIMV